MVDKLNILEDLKTEFMKLFNESKKKYVVVKDAIEETLAKINDCRGNNKEDVKNIIDFMIKPITLICENKHTKLFMICLGILKKLVTYNLIRQNQTSIVIKNLKEMLENASEENVQLKVIETLLPMVNPQVIKLSEELVMNVFNMCLRIFSFKSSLFKNPISALFKQLMITVYGFLDTYLNPIINKKIQIFIDQLNELKNQKKKEIENDQKFKENNLTIKNNDLNDPKQLHENENNQLNIEVPNTDHKELNNGENKENEKNVNNFENQINNDDNDNVKKEVNSKDDIDHKLESNIVSEKNEINQNDLNSLSIKNNVENNNNINNDENNKKMTDDKNDNQEIKIDINEKQEVFFSSQVNYNNLDFIEYTNVDVYSASLSLFKILLELLEGKRKDLIYPSTYTKCLSLELLAGIIEQAGTSIVYLKDFMELVHSQLLPQLKILFESNLDYILGLKVFRLAVQVIVKLNCGIEFIPNILKFGESQTLWQKLLAVESMVIFFQSPILLGNLFTISSFRNIYSNLIQTMCKLSYSSITSSNAKGLFSDFTKKNNEVDKNKNFVSITYSAPVRKLILTSTILTESDYNLNISTVYPNTNILLKFMFDIFTSFKESIIKILAANTMGESDKNDKNLFNINTSLRIELREFLKFEVEDIKNSLTALLVNSNDEAHCQGYLNIFLYYISIFGSIGCEKERDSFLNDICKLSIPNNHETSLKMKDKNILIIKTLFNIAHCNSIMDYSSWSLLIDVFQKVYMILLNTYNHMLKPDQEFEIDVIIKNMETTIKKYNPKYGIDQERSIIRDSNLKNTESSEKNEVDYSALKLGNKTNSSSQKKESSNTDEDKDKEIDLEIFSTAIDSLFINSFTYSPHLLKNITKAYLNSTLSLIEDSGGISEYTITYIHFNIIKLLEISIINLNKLPYIWEDVIETFKSVACKNFTNISRFSLDCISILNMFVLVHFNPEVSKSIFTQENKDMYIDEFHTYSIQNVIFKPFKDITQSVGHINLFLNMVYNLGKIVQNCGIYIDYFGWEYFYSTLTIMISKADDNLIDQSFKLIELIIYDFSQILLIENSKSLNNLLESYSLNKKIQTSHIKQ